MIGVVLVAKKGELVTARAGRSNWVRPAR